MSAGIGTARGISTSNNYGFLSAIKGSQQLKIEVELGYLYIEPRNTFASAYSSQISNNQFYQSPGGTQGETFIRNSETRKLKSNNLQSVVNGLIPQHIEPYGAPYSTFVESTLLPKKTHPYYNLIKGPDDAPELFATSTLNYTETTSSQPVQVYAPNLSPESVVLNKLGPVFIPATTKTSAEVAGAGLPVLTSYNIWSVENLGGVNLENKNQLQNFVFVNNLGYVPKNGIANSQLQPYAQTISYPTTAQIAVYSINSQVILKRLYPMSLDYAHQEDSKYLIYNTATANGLSKKSVGLHKTKIPSGFTLVFSSINNSDSDAVGNPVNSVSFINPMLLISFGDLNASAAELKNYTDNQYIGKYTIAISANQAPRLFFNLYEDNLSNLETDGTTNDQKNKNRNANRLSISLPNIKPLTFGATNSGSVSPNDYELYVYFSGPYMFIGNNKNPASWHSINSQSLNLTNGNENVPYELFNFLNESSEIKIQAQYMNFVFSYGPPLFNPHDDQNIPSFTSILPNTLNFIENQNVSIITDVFAEKPIAENKTTWEDEKKRFIKENAAATYQSVNVADYIGGASVYYDIRAGITTSDYLINVEQVQNNDLYNIKMTMPQHLGGNVFNKFMPESLEVPSIDKSYVKYDLKFRDKKITVSQILSNSLKSMSIISALDPDSSSYIKNSLEISFENLNRTPEGLQVLQFIRNNVCVLRVSAGYGQLYPYFEGMVGKVTVKEDLDKTTITISAADLLYSLFVSADTLIVSKNNMQFPGMKFKNIINSLVQNSELYKHFRYDLGAEDDPTSIAYFLNNDKFASLPRVADSMAVINAAQFRVNAYDESASYFKVLQAIQQHCVQTNLGVGISTNRNFDIPVYYWYTNRSAGTNMSGVEKTALFSDGITMTSRTMLKDRDIFYLRREHITDLMTKNIEKIHGYVQGNSAFQSDSDSMNLSSLGLYRFIDITSQYRSTQIVNQGAFGRVRGKINSITDTIGYIGYERIANFNESSNKSVDTQLENYRLPTQEFADDFVSKWMNAAYSSVYENINLDVFVTKPLKNWGHFVIAIEGQDNIVDQKYLYNSVTYTFEIPTNLIKTKISASKKPIQSI
jgi:hypothetical protein